MSSSRVHLKIYADSSASPAAAGAQSAHDGSPASIDLDAFVPIFHRWIRDHVLSELMLDVVDYKHVHQGPGIVMIGHGSDYYMDQGEGRLGLLYSRKRSGPPAEQLLSDAFRRALLACQLLEREPSLAGKLRFRTNEALLAFPDRLRVENSAAGLAQLRPELDAVVGTVYGSGVRLERVVKDGGPLGVRVLASETVSLGTLLERLGTPASPARLRVL